MLKIYFEPLPKFFSSTPLATRKALPHLQSGVIARAGVGVFVTIRD
jgi:hypothetical protein